MKRSRRDIVLYTGSVMLCIENSFFLPLFSLHLLFRLKGPRRVNPKCHQFFSLTFNLIFLYAGLHQTQSLLLLLPRSSTIIRQLILLLLFSRSNSAHVPFLFSYLSHSPSILWTTSVWELSNSTQRSRAFESPRSLPIYSSITIIIITLFKSFNFWNTMTFTIPSFHSISDQFIFWPQCW